MPASLQARTTRTAISPRLAIRTFCRGFPSGKAHSWSGVGLRRTLSPGPRPATAWLHGRMDALEELRAALPGDVVVTAEAAVEKYRHDWSRDASAGTPV